MSHPVLTELGHADPARRRSACEAAGNDPSGVLLVDALVDALGDEASEVARAASSALQRIGREQGPAQASILIALRRGLRGETARQRLEAAWTWARLEPPPISLLPAVVSSLDEAVGDARWRGARLLVELGRLHAEAIAVVLGLSNPDQPARVRRIALSAGRELAPGDPAVLQAHLNAARSEDVGLRRLALAGLAGLGERTPDVMAAISQARTAGTDPTTRRAADLAAAALESR